MRGSKLFSYVYDQMDASEAIFTINVGHTKIGPDGSEYLGWFLPLESKHGGAITILPEKMYDALIIAEEFYHGYQNITSNEEDINTNQEFEAKTFAIGVQYESEKLFSAIGKALEEFGQNIYISIYGNDFKAFTTNKLDILKIDYLKFGNDFSIENKNNKNANYSKPNSVFPRRLKDVIIGSSETDKK